MKKEAVLLISLVILIGVASFTSAQTEFTEDGYQCLNNQIDEQTCSQLSLEKNIFSTLATGRCTDELKSRADDNCFGSPSCNVKQTSQAIMALKIQNENTSQYEEWVLNQSQTEQNIDWFLQIDSSNSTCSINTSQSNYEVEIGENDKLTETSASQCFSVGENNYQIEIDSDCYSEEFEVSCDGSFSTTTFFETGTSQITHVLDGTEDSSSGETQTKSIQSSCLGNGPSCSYEGTLWGALALSLKESDSHPEFMPYLIGFKNDNQQYIPGSFLHYITGNENYLSDVIEKQRSDGFWFESGNRYYDTAVALFSLDSENSEERENAINWTREDQESNGCWNDQSITDTAFLLHSIEPQQPEETEEVTACESNGHCMKESACTNAGGEVQGEYTCVDQGFDVCCSQQEEQKSCSDVGGNICSSGEVCSGTERSGIPTDTGFCCDGTCEEPEEEEQEYWRLQNNSCESIIILPSEAGPQDYSSEQECENNIQEESDSGFLEDNLMLLIILAIIAILIVLGIMYRKKIISKINGMFGKLDKDKKQPPQGQKRPQQRGPRKRPVRKRTVKKRVPKKRPSGQGQNNEDVFQKLKEMGRK